MKKKNVNYLLLDYIQKMYFRSIEEIIYFCTQKMERAGKSVKTFSPMTIDEYNRVITSGYENDLIELKINLNSYGINTTIGNLEDQIFSEKRSQYIKYKFPNKKEEEVIEEMKNNSDNKSETVWQYEPIILEINEEKKYPEEKIVFIQYKQFIKWNDVLVGLSKTTNKANKHRKEKIDFDEYTINKYNRIYFHSKNENDIVKICSLLKANNINFIVLENEDNFIPFRTEYIVHYYGKTNSSYLQSKWRYEYENNWYNQEKWDPMILVKKSEIVTENSN